MPTGQLFWASCPAANSCMAVGTYVKTSGIGVNLAEQWNGTSWRILPTPNPSGIALSGLLGVACTAPSACTAVGASTTTTGAVRAVAVRWNGTTWTIQPTPSPAGGGALNSVSCTSASACTAVGSSGPVTTLAERWNGTRWRVQPTPNPPGGQNIFLASVACPTSSACTAFGREFSGSGPLTLAERWNGRTWRIQPTPGLVTFDIGFPGVACPTSSACLAVASYTNNGPNLTLAEQWNRTTSGSQPATSRLAAAGGLAPACAHSPLNMAASAWRLNHARPWHWSAAQGLLNRARAARGPLGWCPPT